MDNLLTRQRVHEQLLELKLKHAEQAVDHLCDESAERQTGYSEFLCQVLDAELAQRRDRGTQMRLKLAHLPFHKTLEQFEFASSPRSTNGKSRNWPRSTSSPKDATSCSSARRVSAKRIWR
jgi:DNA replication protein DnaC